MTAGAARAQTPSDWYDSFRGMEAFVVDDSSWRVADPAAPDGAPLLRVRHLLILFRADDGDAAEWPRRNVLLVAFPNGDRWAAEKATRVERRARPGEPSADVRLATAAGAVEAWSGSIAGEGSACAGEHLLVRSGGGGGGVVGWFPADGGTRTVKAFLRDLRESAFPGEGVRELHLLRRLRAPEGAEVPLFLEPSAAWELLASGPPRPGEEERELAPVPDPDAGQEELDAWRSCAWIPASLTPMGLPEGLK